MERVTASYLMRVVERSHRKLKWGGCCEGCGYVYGFVFYYGFFGIDYGCNCIWTGVDVVDEGHIGLLLENDEGFYKRAEVFINEECGNDECGDIEVDKGQGHLL